MHLMPVWPQRCCSQCPCSHLYPGLTVSFSPMRCRNLSCGFLFSEQNAGPLGWLRRVLFLDFTACNSLHKGPL